MRKHAETAEEQEAMTDFVDAYIRLEDLGFTARDLLLVTMELNRTRNRSVSLWDTNM
jgi:hypothetical protein